MPFVTWMMLITPLTAYQGIVSAFSLFSLTNAIADGFHFRRPATGGESDSQTPLPTLSVLIPARDEAATIAACIRSLCGQEYPADWEILVLDDGSTDGTAAIARAAAPGDSRVRVLMGGPLAPGWKGKPNALRQLAEVARGEVLLLTDADCTFAPDALQNAVRHRVTVGADCLSLIPYLDCNSFWEHVIVPLQYDVIFLTLPVRKVYSSSNPAFAAANGAFLLLPAATYRALDGHTAVRAEMAEDIKFSQYVKRSGLRMAYDDGSTTYTVRMYDSLRTIWDGFSKNLFPAMGRSIPVLLIWSLFHLTTQVLPFAFVALALATGNTHSVSLFGLPAAQCAVALAIRIGITLRFRQALWAVLTHPLGWLVTIAIGFNSAYLALSGKGHAWKGRVYQ